MKYSFLFAAIAATAAAIAVRAANKSRNIDVVSAFRHRGKDLVAILRAEDYRQLRTS